MGEKLMRFSDLSGQLAENSEELVGVLVTLHPDLDHPVRLEALPQELEQLGKHAIAAVGLEVTPPGNEEPARYVLTVSNFNKLATHRPMAEVLAGAEPVTPRRRSHNKTTNGEALRSFDTVESAGTPHKGKVSPYEAQLVREHLDEVNKRLASQGLRTIDPANPEHAKRYGLARAEDAEQ
jgi:hypothetical protein